MAGTTRAAGAAGHSSGTPALDAVVASVTRRLVPFLLLMYVMSFLDRANIGFAKAAFQADTGVSDAAFALGAGIFFIGYALFEVPSNLALHKVGARIWMCRIMVTWGLVSAAMVFANSATTFYVLRFLLGVAEAGFFPGVILYLTYWVPASHRGKVMGLFYFGAPLAFIFGGPASGALLELDGFGGLHGWQWMFLTEGLMASLVGVWAFFYLEDRPARSRRLTEGQRVVLESALAAEDEAKAGHSPSGVLQSLKNRKILYCALVYFLIQMSVYGVTFYLPTQVAAIIGVDVGLEVGLLTAVPWACALVASFLIGRYADRVVRRHLLAAATLTVGGLGIAASALLSEPALALLSLCFAAAGFIAVQPVFWTVPTTFLTGIAAASGIALVNSLGSLGGFVAPNVKTWADGAFGGGDAGLLVLAGTTLLGAGLLALVARVGVLPMRTQQEVRRASGRGSSVTGGAGR